VNSDRDHECGAQHVFGFSRAISLADLSSLKPDDATTNATTQYFYHMKRKQPNPQALDAALQDRLIAICAKTSGVTLPA
jgi:hypothetical protein